MAEEHREYLHMVPEHMRESICLWIESPVPPNLLGRFLRALLSNNLMEAFAHADSENSIAMASWVRYLYNHAPAMCWGSPERLESWYEEHADRKARVGAAP